MVYFYLVVRRAMLLSAYNLNCAVDPLAEGSGVSCGKTCLDSKSCLGTGELHHVTARLETNGLTKRQTTRPR